MLWKPNFSQERLRGNIGINVSVVLSNFDLSTLANVLGFAIAGGTALPIRTGW